MSEQTRANTSIEQVGTTEAARLLGLHEVHLRRLVKAGKFPNAWLTDGGHARIPVSDIEAFKASRRVKPAQNGAAA